VNIITKRITYYIVYTMWYFFTSVGLIPMGEMCKLLEIRSEKECADFLHHAMSFFEEKIAETIEIKEKGPCLTWKLGIQKRIFNLVLKYKNTLRENERGSLSLTSCWHRDKCEKIFSNEIIRYTGGR